MGHLDRVDRAYDHWRAYHRHRVGLHALLGRLTRFLTWSGQ